MNKNPKKVMDNCPLKKDKGELVKSECPAIDNVRNIRKELNKQERTGKAAAELVDGMREKLKKAKTEELRDKFCKTCCHKG